MQNSRFGMRSRIRNLLSAATVVVITATMTTLAQGAPFLFTTCGAVGAIGPTQAACDAAYAATPLGGLVTVGGGIQSWSVAASGTYRITAEGAQGASAAAGRSGGRGARVAAEFDLSAGDVLRLAVGQKGSNNLYNGGGGGGSFVVGVLDAPLLVAGGGGGTRTGAGQNGHDASITQFGTTGSGSNRTGGGALKTIDLGLGGRTGGRTWGSGGAGFFGDGADDLSHGTGGTGGSSWFNGLLGGVEIDCTSGSSAGGFGGGGAGAGCAGGGGGGGYSGGDGGYIAGGGGSFLSGMNQIALAGVGFGDGFIQIDLLTQAIPEPTTLALFGFGLIGLGTTRRRRK